MSKLKNLIAGFAGAVALNILHETLKKKNSDMPRIDLLGENALQETLNFFGGNIDNKKDLYKATLAADIIGNTLYYSLIGTDHQKYIWPKAILIGLTAGAGAVALPQPMGLDEQPVAKNNEVKIRTAGYYLFGAIVTGLVLNMINKKSTIQPQVHTNVHPLLLHILQLHFSKYLPF